MEYRKLPGSDEKISIIGMGSSVIGEQAERDIIETVQFAMDSGINYFDMAGGHAVHFFRIRKGSSGLQEGCDASDTFRSGLRIGGIRLVH